MHLYCMYIVTDSKHTHGPDAWSALCVQMFWLSNPFVRLRPARQFLLPVCCWVGAGWSWVWGGRVWTMMSTQTLIAKAVLPLHIERLIFLVLNTQYVSYTVDNIIVISNLKWESYLSMSVWGLNLAWMTVLQRKWGRYLLMSSVRMEASLSSGRWSGLLWAHSNYVWGQN